jgi:hypothetical protein
MVAPIDYDRLATISWLNQPNWSEGPSIFLEEYWEELTLKEAVTFAVDHLDARYRKSVVIKCGVDKYNMFDIEEMYRQLNHPRKLT